MSLPIFLSTAVQSFYNIVDGIFVSQIGEEAMTAITLTTPVTIAPMAVGTGIAAWLLSKSSRLEPGISGISGG